MTSITLKRLARLAEHRPSNTLWVRVRGRDYIIASTWHLGTSDSGGNDEGEYATPWGGLLVIELRNGVVGQWLQPTI